MAHEKSNEKIGSMNRGTPCESGLCTFCRVDCHGKCETWLSSMLGRKSLVPQDYGNASLAADSAIPAGVSYASLKIRGRIYGSEGLPEEQAASKDVTYTDARIGLRLGTNGAYDCRFPFVIGALSRNPVVDKYWDSFAIGAALCGIPLVIGENVGGGDTKTEFDRNGVITRLPDLDKRIETYFRYYDGKGALFVQLNPNDSHNGVGDYVAAKYGDKVCIEFKWGQGAKPLNGEGRITDPEFARFMKSRSYCIRPNPFDTEVMAAFAEKKIPYFTRYTSMAYPDLRSPEQVGEELASRRDQLAALGARRFALKTGGFGAPALALGIKLASELGFELFTVDGSGGGTGMSPVDVMDNWGVPSLLLQAMAWRLAARRASLGKKVVDIAAGGGIARPSQIFKTLALGAPYVKAVCMSRAFMVPAFLGSNIEGVIYPERRAALHGGWTELPKTVSQLGATAEEIFAGYSTLKNRLGAEECSKLPFGAIAMWTMCDRLGAGLQMHMAGARKFALSRIRRDDISAVNEETARATGIDYIIEQGMEEAMSVVSR